MKLKKIAILCIVLLAFLPACIRKASHLKRFPQIEKNNCCFNQTEDLSLFIKALNSIESKSHFGIDFLNKGYVPIQIKVENSGAKTYIIRNSYLNLPMAESKEIAKLLHWDTSLFVCLAGAPALLFWWPATIWVAQGGYDMYRENKKINKLIKRCCLEIENEEVAIRPYDTLNRFVFVNTVDFIPWFDFKVYNEDDKKLMNFNIDLRN